MSKKAGAKTADPRTMSDAKAEDAGVATPDAGKIKGKGRGKGKRKLLVGGGLVALLLVGGGLWFAGLLPGSHRSAGAAKAAVETVKPVFVDMPEIIANLNAGARRSAYIKLHAKLQLARASDAATIAQVMPRLQDMFQTYLRETRPEELRGSEGTWRLREELIARANIAADPVQVTDVLFTDLLVQ